MRKSDRFIAIFAMISMVCLVGFTNYIPTMKAMEEEPKKPVVTGIYVVTDIEGDEVELFDGWDCFAYFDDDPEDLHIGQAVAATVTTDGEVINVVVSPFDVVG